MRRPVFLLLAFAVSCTTPAAPTRSPQPSGSQTSPAPGTPSPTPGPVAFDGDRAYRTVRHLASVIGPRETTSSGYRRAATFIADAFRSLGYTVSRQRFSVPSGRSAGVAVAAGTSENVVAEPPGFDPSAPHVLVGAHLDTVVRSPGANDNASGVAVMMELARLAGMEPPPAPVVFVAFGGEETRRSGSRGGLHGSRHYVSSMSSARRRALQRVLILDVVGRGATVRVCSAGATSKTLINAMRDAARRVGVPSRECLSGRLYSDHVAFEESGFTVAWLWTGNFSQLHTSRDTVRIVSRAHLTNTGRVSWEGLRTLRL